MKKKNEKKRRIMAKRRRMSKKQRERQRIVWIMLAGAAVMLAAALILFMAKWLMQPKIVSEAPDYAVNLLTVNEFSRPGTATDKINGIVIHYTANPGTTADQNRNYFEGLKDSGLTNASSHFIVGLDGEIVQCIPTAEIAYASNDRNIDTVSIEVCHPDETGRFNKKSYDSLVHLAAWLCGKFDLSPKDIIRHYDVTGKACPLYFVENEDEWKQFIKAVEQYIEENGVKAR